MKVAYILTNFPCLTETFALREIQSLRELGLEIIVLAVSRGQNAQTLADGPSVFYRPAWLSLESAAAMGRMLIRRPLRSCKLLLLILRLLCLCPREALSVAGNLHTIAYFAAQLDREKIDHVHACFLSWPAVIALALSIVTGRPFSISAHARDIFVEHGAVGLKARRSKFIRTCTGQGLHHLKANLPAECDDKLHVVYHGVETVLEHAGIQQRESSASNSDTTIIAVGRLVEKKGFDVLIRAFALVVRQKPDCRLMIVGDGPEKKHLMELIQQSGLQHRVELTGWQEPQITQSLIAQATLLAAPSRAAQDGDMDGIPNVILEAFAAGVPVVAGNLQGITEAVKDRETGLIVEPADVHGLASAINELLDDPQLRSRLAHNACQAVKERFDPAENAGQLAGLLSAGESAHRRTVTVVHILEGLVGGTATYVRNVLPHLVANGFDVTLICSLNRSCPDARDLIAELRTSGVKVHVIPMFREIRPLKDIRSFIIILRLLIREKPDIVHTHCSKAGALGRFAAWLSRRPVIVHSPHCFAFLRTKGRLKRLAYLMLERLLGRLTTKIVAVSRSEAGVAVDSHIVGPDRCIRISNGLSNGRLAPETSLSQQNHCDKTRFGLAEDARVVTTACRLVDYKGVFRFLEAAKASRTANTVFMLAGDGRLRDEAQEFVHQNRLCTRVRLLGHVSDMEQLYTVSDLVVLGSDAEAQPYVLLEAMRAKCPVVATSVMGSTDLVAHEQTGFLVEPSPAAIAAAVDTLLADQNKRTQCAQNAYNYFREHHSLEKQVSRLTETYRDCIRNGAAHGPKNPG
jgi:glycosyltransferase involved in cell wall biosynthesis